MRRLLTIFPLIVTAVLAHGQSIPFTIDQFPGQEFYLKKALDHLTQGDGFYFDEENPYYRQALPHFEQANAFNPNNADLNFKLGVCYLKSNNKFKARPFFEKAYALDTAVDARIHYLIGKGYHVNGEWDQAIEAYERHGTLQLSREDRKETNKRLEECRTGKVLVANPVKVTVELLDDVINSPFPEYVPLITADESVLYFTSKREDTYGGGVDLKNGEYFEDIYFSEKINGKWSKARNAGPPLNTKTHDAGAGLSPDGHTMFIYKGDKDNGDILVSYLVDGKWSKPEGLGKNINTKFHESAACVSPDGNTLYFVSDRPGGIGQRDIYTSEFDMVTRKWKPAVNLGSVINTPYDEEGVFMHPDGRTLYFSSKGPGNIGGYDVFYSVKTDEGWSTPVNIGYPVSTPDDDVFFTVSASGEHAYYSSFKKSGKGEKDIYLVTFDPGTRKAGEMAILKGTIRNDANGQPITARIELIDLDKSEHIGNFYSDSRTGKYLLSLPAGKTYGAIAYADGFVFKAERMEIPDHAEYREINVDLRLQPMDVGLNVVLTDVVFESGKATLLPESERMLDRLVKLMEENEKLEVEIGGHTDNTGDANANLQLSDRRAQSVVDYLVAHGVKKQRLKAVAYGQSSPIASNETPEGREKNRRIEFRISAR